MSKVSGFHAPYPETALFVSRHREKLIHAIIFFVKNTKNCKTTKLFKLLNFLDFEHYRQTGQSVTGLTYKAWKKGPVPDEFWRELRDPSSDMVKDVAVFARRDSLTDEVSVRDFVPRIDFNSRIFTKRELQIMDRLALYFVDATADQMSQYSHEKNLPWVRVYKEHENNEIPYKLTLTTAPIIPDMPTIAPEELEYLEQAYKQVDADTSD